MKRVLQKLLFLCMILCVISFAKLAAQENFASPIVIGQIHPLMPHYTNSQNSCLFANDIANSSNDVVYQFSVADTYSVTMSMCGALYDSYLWLYDSGFNQIGSDDDGCGTAASILTQTVTPGTYYIVCEGYSFDCGNYTLDVYANPIDAGTLNVCALPHYIDSKNTCDYANEVAGGSNDVIYRFALGSTQSVTMSLCNGTSYDSYLYLYNSSFAEINSNDDVCGVYSSITQTLNAGTYYLVVEGYGSSCGNYTLDLAVTDLPPVLDIPILPDLTDPCAISSLTAPTATDVCAGVISGVPNVTLPIITSSTITWTFNDGGGNIITQNQNVVITDVTAPVPDIPVLTDVNAECEILFLTSPTATDNCGGPVVVTNDAILPINAQGTTIVTWYYEDINGNISTQTQNVVLTDITAPVADIPVLADVTDECSASVVPPTATDNCGAIINGTPNVAFPITHQGTTVITWTYDDGNGNTSTQTQNVILNDITAPEMTCQSDVLVDADPGVCGAVVNYALPVVTDNCSFPNLIINGDASDGLNNWNVISNGGNGWNAGGGAFVTSFDWDTKYQVVDLLAAGYDASILDFSPDIYVSDDYVSGAFAGDPYYLTIELRDASNTAIASYSTGVISSTSTWQTASTTFSGYPAGVRYVYFEHGGHDVEWWAGWYGAIMTNATVKVLGPKNQTTGLASNSLFPVGTTTNTFEAVDAMGNTTSCSFDVVVTDNEAPVPDLPVLADITDDCEVSALVNPTATDNCAGSIIGTHDAVLPIMGTSTVTWSYDDGNGNIITQTQEVIINDIIAPVPDVLVMDDITAECEIAELIAPTGTDNCGGPVTVTHDAILPVSTQGTTVVTWTFADANMNTSTLIQNVIIIDVTAPVPDVPVLADFTEQCEVWGLPNPSATDNCGGFVLVSNDAIFPISTQGTTVVTWTYNDGNGNFSTQTQNVVIEDVTGPTPDVWWLDDVLAQCEVGTLDQPWATDNCGGPVTVTHDAILPIEDQGTTVVTWTYEDMYGNITTQTQNVIIEDTQAPVPSISGFQIVILADNSYADNVVWNLVDASSSVVASGGPYTNGHAGEILEVVSNINAENGPYTFNGWGLGTFFDNNWSFEIYCNENLVESGSYVNTETASYSGIVGCQSSLDVLTDACSITSLVAPTATDNCVGSVIGTHDAVLPIMGTSTITWSYDDGNGNISTQTQEVIINDIIAPVPDVLVMDDITDECSVTELIAPTGTDNCGGPVTVSHDAILPITSQGTTVVTWTFADANMNTSTLAQNVVINDITDPVIVCADEIVITNDPGLCSAVLNPTNTIIYDIPLSQLVGMGGAAGCTVMDAYYCGGAGGPSWVSTGSETPVSVTVQFYQIYNDAGVALPVQFNGVSDNNYNSGISNCTPELVTLNLDPANYIVGALNTVIVSSANCFVLAQNPDPTWAPGSFARVIESYQNDFEPTVTDNCGFTTLTNDMQPSYSVGTHTLTWTATDNNGNSASCEQTITVVDASGPIPDLAVLPDVTAECEITFLPEPTATDNCGGLVTVTNDATLPYDADGLYVVTWTYTDESDNVTTQTQNVIIDDYTYPVLDVPVLADLNGDCFVDPVIPTATDNCSGVINGVPDYPMPFTGTYTVTWSFDDGNGNITTQLQNVTINDATPPVPDLLTLADLTDECSVNPEPPTATDDCSGVVTGYTMWSLPITAQGTTVLTWIFEDNNGNISTQDQNVIIQDVTYPEIEAPEDLLMSTDPYSCEMSGVETVVYYIHADQISGMYGPSGLDCSSTPDLYTCYDIAELSWTSEGTTSPAFVNLEIYQIYNDNSSNLPVTFNGNADSDYTGPDGWCSSDLVTISLSPDNYIVGGDNTVEINSFLDCIVFDQNPNPDWEEESYARVIVGYSLIDAPAATDNCELVSLVSDIQPSYPIGNHTITWTATDIAGNITTAEQNLVVADLAGPIADEAVLADITSACEITTLIEPTALDYCTGPVTGVADVTLPLVETTTIHWTYTDANGNITVQEQNAIIEDNLAPVPDVAELDDVIVSCEVTTLDVPTATDNCTGIINGVHDADLPITEQGGTIVTWTYTDANGNVSTQFQVIIIMDYTGPVADVVELDEVFACGDVLTLTAPTATDECSGNIVGEHNATLPITESTLVTWSYTDNIGNVTYQDQQITITDIDETVNDNSPYLTSNQDGATYQWLDCDNSYAPIDGATSQTFFATVNGNYAVEVTLNGCAEISDCYNVTNVGIGNDVSLTYNVEVYPNPTRGTITIEMPVEGETSWRLLNVTGQIVMEGNSAEQLFNLDLEEYTPGVYMLNLIQGGINTNMRVVRK